MGRGYTFTCHTCRIVYEIGYGSYGHFCLEPQAGETLAGYKSRVAQLPDSEQDLAIGRNFNTVMVLHSLHEWDTEETEFVVSLEEYEARRKGYTSYDFSEVWHKRWSQAIDVARRAFKANPSLTPAELVLLGNEAVNCDVLDEDRANIIIANSKPKPPLPKDLQRKLRNWKARTAAHVSDARR